MVADLILRLKNESIGIYLISHDMHDVFDLCDRVMVMNKGRNVGAFRIEERCAGRAGVHRDGGMTPQIAVPTKNLITAEGLTPQQAAMVGFLTIDAHAIARSDAVQGDRVLVTCAGSIGVGTALFAQLKGADVSLLDLSADRAMEVALQFEV